MKNKKFACYVIALCVCLCAFLYPSCIDVQLKEKHVFIPHYEWSYDFTPQIPIDIDDTTQSYKLYIVVKHENDFDYLNLWLKLNIHDPQDSINTFKINVPLGTNDGGWMGSGFYNVFERRFLWTTLKFKTKGQYHFNLNQLMRDNPIKKIVSVGIRIEK